MTSNVESHPPRGGDEQSQLGTRAVRSFLWAGVSFGSNKLVLFVATLVLARLIAPAEFGVVAAGLTLIALLEIGLDLGVGAALVYEQQQGISHRVRVAYSLNLLVSAGLTALGIAVAPAVAAFLHEPEATSVFRVMFCYLILRGASQVQTAVLQRDLRYRERAVIDISRAVFRGATSIGLALDGKGVWALVIGLLVGEVVGLLASAFFVPLRPALRFPRAVVGSLLTFGLAILGLKAVGSLYTSGDLLIVGNRLGTRELGLYSIAARLPQLVIDSVYWIFASVAFAFFSQARQHGPEVFRGSMLRALRLTTLFGFSAGAGLAILAPTAVPVLFSARWQEAVAPAVILSLASGVSSIGYASGDIFPAVGRPGLLLRLTAVSASLAIAGFWFAAPYGLAAVACVHLVFHLGFGLLRLHIANRLLGATWAEDLRAIWPSLVTAAGVTALALPVSLLMGRDVPGLVLTVLAGAAGGFAILWVVDRATCRDVSLALRGGLR